MPDEPFNPGRTFFQPLPIRGADPASFRVLNALFAIDASKVYYRYGKVPQADPASFQALGPGYFEEPTEPSLNDRARHPIRHFQGYAKDDHNVFHYALTIGRPSVVTGADPATYELLRWGYARDRSRVYCELDEVKGAKPDDFRQLNHVFSVTSQAVYYLNRPILGADPDSCSLLCDALLKDDRSVYLNDRAIEGADPSTYQAVGVDSVGKDRDKVYAHGVPIEGADPATFVAAGGLYQKDKDRAYFLGKPIPKADPTSFRFVRENDAEDDRHLYKSGHPSRRMIGKMRS